MFRPFAESYIDVKEEEPIDEKLKLAIKTMNDNGTWKRFIPETNEYINIYDLVGITEPPITSLGRDYLYPLVVDMVSLNYTEGEKINDFIVKEPTDSCPLCDYYDFKFENPLQLDDSVYLKKTSIALNEIVPTNLVKKIKWKNYLVVPNFAPYYENHFMIISLDHMKDKIVGSQFDILNYTKLYELLSFYYLNGDKVSFLHNYAHIGSQEHLHLHFIYNDEISFYDKLADAISYKCFTDLINQAIWSTSNLDGKDIYFYDGIVELPLRYPDDLNLNPVSNQFIRLQMNIYLSNDRNIFLCRQVESTNIYGINGFLISVKKDWVDDIDNFKSFVSVVHGFLNSVELSLTHTFCQFWTKSDNYLNIYIITQRRINMDAQAINIRDIESARNLRMDMFGNFSTPDEYFAEITRTRNLNNIYYNTDFFNKETIYNTFKEYIKQTSNPIIDSFKYDLSFELLKEHRLFVLPFVVEAIKNKKVQDSPSVLLSISPFGVGMNQITYNKDMITNIFKMNIDESIILSTDDIRLYIPLYKNTTSEIVNKLNPLRTSNITTLIGVMSDYSQEDFDIIKTISIDDIIFGRKNDEIKKLRLDTLERLYDTYIMRPQPGSALSNYDLYMKSFVQCNPISKEVVNFIIKEAIKRKINIIIDSVDISYDNFSMDSDGNQIYPADYQKYLILSKISNTDESKKLVLINLLKRAFLYGKIVDLTRAYYRIQNNESINQPFITNLTNFKKIQYNIINDKIDISSIKIQITSNTLGELICDTPEYKAQFNVLYCDTRTTGQCGTPASKRVITIGPKQVMIDCVEQSILEDEKNISIKNLLNNEISKINNKYLFNNNNIRTMMIYDFYVNYIDLLETFIGFYNSASTGIILEKSDIRVILKGSSSIRLDLINYIDIINNLLKQQEKEINIDENFNKFINIFKLMIKEIEPDKLPAEMSGYADYYDTFGRGNIDFTVVLNKEKFLSEELFNVVLKYIEKIAIKLLNIIREKYELYRYSIFNLEGYYNDLINLYNKMYGKLEYQLNGNNIYGIFHPNGYIGKDAANITINTPLDVPEQKISDRILLFTNDICEGKDEIFIEDIRTPSILTTTKDTGENFYHILFDKTFKKVIIDREVITKTIDLDLLRLKTINRFFFGTTTPFEILEVTGDLVNISFCKWKNSDVQYQVPDFVKSFNFKYPLYNFSLESYTIDKQIIEFNRILFVNSLNIWNQYNYIKKLNKYVFLIIIYLMKNNANINLFTAIFNHIISKINTKEIIDFTAEEWYTGIIKVILNPLVLYLNTCFIFYNSFNELNKYLETGERNSEYINQYVRDYNQLAFNLKIKVELDEEYIKTWIQEFESFLLILKSKIEFITIGLGYLSSVFSLSNKKISTINDVDVEKWGGGITRDVTNEQFLKYTGIADGPIINVDASYTVEEFFNNIITQLELKFVNSGMPLTYIFTGEDLRKSKIIGAGSFGYGLSLTGTLQSLPATKKNFLIKIIPLNTGSSISDNLIELTKETFIPFQLSQINNLKNYTYNVFNENYLVFYFTDQLRNKLNYSQILSMDMEFNIDEINHYFSLNPTELDDMRDGNMGFVIMSGATDNMTDMYDYIFAVLHINQDPSLTYSDFFPFNYISNTIEQLLFVHTLCYVDNTNTIYITHNDIKPGNIVFTLDFSDVYNPQIYTKIIDHGANLISQEFFNIIEVFTQLYRDLVMYPAVYDFYGNVVSDNCVITCPLFDLGSVCISILESMLNKSEPSYYNDLRLDDDAAIGTNYLNQNYQYYFLYVYDRLNSVNQVNYGTPEFRVKVKLTIKLLEITNILGSIRHYYVYKIKPEHDDLKDEIVFDKPKYRYCHFIASDFSYYDIDSGDKVNFDGEDYSLYKNIVAYLEAKINIINNMSDNIIDSKFNFANGRVSNLLNMNNIGLPGGIVRNGLIYYDQKYKSIFVNPSDDGFIYQNI